MAASLGDLIQIIDNQTYLGEELMNVYYYRITSITGLDDTGLEVIGDWFETNVMSPVADLQNELLVHTTLEVRNLSNNLDFYETNVNLAGALTGTEGTVAPSFVTAGYQLLRESLATRNGYKRFSGLTEANISGNNYVVGASSLEAVEDALSADIVLGVVTVAEPVIVRRPIVPPVGTSYTYSSIGGAQFRGVGTQNTRKP